MFVSNAYAEGLASSTPGQGGGGFSFVMMFVIFFIFIYFTIWRPQSKRAKEQQTLLNSLAKGDEVITAGGLLGRINKLTGQYIQLSIEANTDIIVQKSAVVSVLPKGTMKSIE
jgi:preprotein translocase subunit YajC